MFWSSASKSAGEKRKREEEEEKATAVASPLALLPPTKARPILNSSRVKPEAGAAHNLEVPDLLQLPDPILSRIFAYALQVDGPIPATATGLELATQTRSELSLFRVSKKTRILSLPIFYQVNSFELIVQDFNMAALFYWWERAASLRSHEVQLVHVSALQSLTVTPGARNSPAHYTTIVLTSESAIHIMLEGHPDWDNLRDWLRLYHQDWLPRYHSYHQDGLSKAVTLAFDAISAYAGQEWKVAKKCLPALRGFLALNNAGWQEEDNTGDISEETDGTYRFEEIQDSEDEQEEDIMAADELGELPREGAPDKEEEEEQYGQGGGVEVLEEYIRSSETAAEHSALPASTQYQDAREHQTPAAKKPKLTKKSRSGNEL